MGWDGSDGILLGGSRPPDDPEVLAARARRERRQAGVLVLVVLGVLAAGAVGTALALGLWAWPGSDDADGPACPTPTRTAALPSTVRVNVLNATDRGGLAAEVANTLAARGFQVLAVGNDETASVAESAQVRHGPELLAAAQAVAAQVPGAVLIDDGRGGDVVDLSLGDAYQQMATEEEAAALVEPAPVSSPPGCIPSTTSG